MKNRNFFLGLFLSLIMLSPIFVQAAGGEGGTNEQTGFTVNCGNFNQTISPIPKTYCDKILENLKKQCTNLDKSITVNFNQSGSNTSCQVIVSNCSGLSCDTIKEYLAAAVTEYNGGVAQASTASIDNPMTIASSPQVFIGKIINAVMRIVGSLALLMFILGGLIWMTSAGSPEKVKKGRDIVIWSVLGLVVVFASYGLVSFLIKNVK